jgi:hypothetical protein
MNRKNLTAAILAGLAGVAGIVGTAQAVNINPDGLGQVLIYPYYTTNGDNVTLLSVVNTTGQAKAVKVRFKEGKNSREVLDFNLYMSRYDVWTAMIADADGTPTLFTADTSCTVPYIKDWDHDPSTPDWTDGAGNVHVDGVQAFLPWGMNDVTGDADAYRPISDATEGYFEMIEMGAVEEESDAETWITHVDGVPADCAAVSDMWFDPDVDSTAPGDEPIWVENPDLDMDDRGPIGGMFGGASLVNVAGGAMYSYDAKAINGYNSASVFGNTDFLHARPGNSHPSLNDGDIKTGTVFANGMAYTSPTLDRPVDAMSYVFMHDSLMNEYTTNADLNAGTEWVVNFPTKAFYVYTEESGYDDVLPPFTQTWDSATGACEPVTLDKIWDREEQTFFEVEPPPEGGGPIVSPKPPGSPTIIDPVIPFTLCYEVSVIEFGPKDGDTTAILGSSNFHNINNEDDQLGYVNGWARLDLFNYITDVNDDGEAEWNERQNLGGLNGLPVTGFAVMSFQNGFLGEGNDIMGNYGGIFQHKYTRKIGSSFD